VQEVGDQLLARARFALDQRREGRIRVLVDLALQFLQRRAPADQRVGAGDVLAGDLRRPELQRVKQDLLQGFRVAGLGDELRRPQRARVAGVRGVVLPREHQDLHRRRMREQVGDQLETLVGAVRLGRQPEVDQRELGRGIELSQQAHRMPAGVAHPDLEVLAKRIGQRVGDQRVVVDDQQARFLVLSHVLGSQCIAGMRFPASVPRSARATPAARRKTRISPRAGSPYGRRFPRCRRANAK